MNSFKWRKADTASARVANVDDRARHPPVRTRRAGSISNIVERNFTFELIDQARRAPDAPALLLGDRTIPYRALDELVWQFAGHLHAQGVRAGDVVGLTFAEELPLVLTMLAVARLGATIFSIPRHATSTQRPLFAARAHASALATDQPSRFDAGVRVIPIDLAELTSHPAPVDTAILDETPSAPWLLISGSGTTGQSKLIPLTHGQARERSRIAATMIGLTPSDRIAPLSHFDFSHSKFRLHEALWAGASCALGLWDDADPIQACARQSLTAVFATVFHAEKLLERLPAGTERALGDVRLFEITSSTVTDDLRQRVRARLTSNVFVRYGINEAGLVTLAGPPEVFATRATVGRPPPEVQVQVVDDAGQPVAPGTVGLVRIRSPGQVDGYQDHEEATRQHFRQGWFMPADLGMLTADGQLIHCGRADHMMIMNGINIYPSEIEEVLTAHPDVRDAAAVPLRHRVHQDVPICAAALAPGARTTERELLQYARERLGSHAPRHVMVFERIPRNHEGKLARAELGPLIDGWLRRAEGCSEAPRQLSTSFRLVIAIPAQADLACLDRWLTQALGIALEPIRLGRGVARPDGAHDAASWIWRCLLLARVLLQAGRVPVFDPPRIDALTRDEQTPDRWRATVSLAFIDHLPRAAYADVLDSAARLCAWAAANPPDDDRRRRFHDFVEHRLVARLLKVAPGGKSTVPVLQAAHRRGIPFIHLGGGVFQLGWGSQARRLDHGTTAFDAATGARLAQSKVHTARLLRMAGLPGPTHEVVRGEAAALAAARRIGWPVVIKPADRGRGRGEGVSIDVADDDALRTAFDLALRASRSKEVIVERQVAGVCHRLFIANGKLFHAVKRLPRTVGGDGRHTLAQPVNDEDVTDLVHAENARLAVAAAALFGLPLAGIDLITTDITQAWSDHNAIVHAVREVRPFEGRTDWRQCIPRFLNAFIRGNGRIPVEVFVGGQAAWDAATARWRALVDAGSRAHLTDALRTLGPQGDEWPMHSRSAYHRARALALSAQVDAIVIAVAADEFSQAALPFEGVDRIDRLDRSGGGAPI